MVTPEQSPAGRDDDWPGMPAGQVGHGLGAVQGRRVARQRHGGPAVHLDDQMRDRGVQRGLADQVMPEPDQPRPGRQQADVHAPGQGVMNGLLVAAGHCGEHSGRIELP